MLSLGVLILLAVIASALVRPDGDEAEAPTAPPTTTLPGVATTDVACPPEARASAVTLRREAENWRIDAPYCLPLVGVTDIVDGDTLDVRAGGETFRVRVFGVNTPERGRPCYREATDALRRLAGGEVRLLPDVRLRDSSRPPRELRYLFTPDGRSIDAALIADGLALAWREDGAYRDVLVGLEDEARALKRGCLWMGG